MVIKMENKKEREMDVSKLLAEIEALKAEVAALKGKKVKVVKVPCPGVTGKGVQCKKFCVPGEATCKVHGRPVKEKPKKEPRVPKPVCGGLNMRGNPCKRKCVDGETWCERHDPSLPVPEKKGKGKSKKVVPVHTHGIGEEPVIPCELCETHGDMFDEAVTEGTVVGEWDIDEKKLEEFIENFEIPEEF
jgi:hypothetical protein